MVKDIPIPDNQSIIIFSATGGGEGGRVRQNIGFSALTAITLTGGVETDFVRITPAGSSFAAVAKFHKAFGETTFAATATTAGDEERNLEGVAVSFSFRVLVIGVDFPHLVQSFFEFPVGAAVAAPLNVFFAAPQMQLNIPKVPSAIVSSTYGTTRTETDAGRGGLSYTVWDGEPSGISLDPELDEYNYVRGASLSGVALRPGIYYRVFEISSYDDGGGLDPFPGSTGYGIVIINIYDDRQSPKIVVPIDYQPDDDALRVIRHGIEGYVAARLTGEFTRSGDDWTRTVSEPISEGVSDVWQYQMTRDETTGVWTLQGRNYLSDESAPSYTSLATVTVPYSGEVPPNVGWTNGVLAAGGSHYYVPGSGFFDFKGERTVPVEGADPYTGPVYQQQPIVSAQYAGWANPPATEYAEGLYLAPCPDGKWRVSAAALAVDGAEITKQTIGHAAIPYHPPTAAPAIGGVNYRDLALLIERQGAFPVAVNAHLPHESGGLELRMGRYVAAVPEHYTWLRQLPPPMAAGVMPKTIKVAVTIESSQPPHESYSNQYVCSRGLRYSPRQDWGGFVREFKDWNNEHGEKKEKQQFKATVPADAWMRQRADLLSGLMGAISSDSAAMSFEAHETNYRVYGESDTALDGLASIEYFSDFVADEVPTGEAGTQSGRMLMVLASGRNETDATVGLYAAGLASASGTMQTQKTSTSESGSERIYRDGTVTHTGDGPVTTTDGPYTRSMAAGMVSPMCHRVSAADLIFSGLTVETYAASFGGALETAKEYYDDASATWINEAHTTTITATHEHVSYSGENLPPGLIGRGWTHIVKTIDGVTTDTWHDDPGGTVYEGLYVDYGAEFDYGDLDMPSAAHASRSAGRLGWRNESWTRVTETFSTEA